MNITKAGYHGILLPDLNVGFDYSGTKSQHTFISHAHADHMPRSKASRVYCTPNTHKLMQLRGFEGEAVPLDFGEPLETDRARITLYPAGHILGSAMVFVESEEGNVLYTGDYRTPPSPASEGFSLPDQPVHHFITEATFALPIYKWKSYETLARELQTFAVETLEEDYTPIFLAYSLGKAQEVMHLLAPTELPVQIHDAGYKLCEVYEKAGIDLENYALYNPQRCEGHVLITTRAALNNGFASTIRRKRRAYCSGWASHGTTRSRLTAHKLIPLSDHLDFFELIDLCKKLDPQEVYLTHTPDADVVQHYLNELDIKSQFLD